MTREDAIRILASSCIPGSKQTEALETLIPELRESEDERMMREFNDWLCEEIECLTNDLRDEEDRRTLNMLCYVLTKVKDWLEKQKEQKPAESISQPTVQGKGVYKICPRCKERMVRDDSMVYTSMPPQYGYECPKCGEMEFDTVMYDNPEMEEQKPNSTEDMPYITDEHFYEREPADSFKYKLAEYMTRCCTKKEGPYGYEYGISAESILKMAEEELLKRGVVQKPAEWSEEHIADIFEKVELAKIVREQGNNALTNAVQSAMIELSKVENTEWSEDDEEMIGCIIDDIREAKRNSDKEYFKELCDKGIAWLKSLRPSWKPSEEQMEALERASMNEYLSAKQYDILVSLYEQLKKL